VASSRSQMFHYKCLPISIQYPAAPMVLKYAYML
jgi:hypothetical protein